MDSKDGDDSGVSKVCEDLREMKISPSDEGRPKRTIKYTEKYAEYQRDLYMDQRSKLVEKINEKLCFIENLMRLSKGVEDVANEVRLLDKLWFRFDEQKSCCLDVAN